LGECCVVFFVLPTQPVVAARGGEGDEKKPHKIWPVGRGGEGRGGGGAGGKLLLKNLFVLIYSPSMGTREDRNEKKKENKQTGRMVFFFFHPLFSFVTRRGTRVS